MSLQTQILITGPISDQLRPKRRHEDKLDLLVQDLRARIQDSEMPGCIVPRTDAVFLARFIRYKDYNPDKALRALQNYYDCIHKHRKMHRGIRPSHFPSVFESEFFAFLKHRFDGVGVAVGRIKYWNPNILKILDLQRGTVLIAEQYMYQVDLQKNGICLIADFEGLRFEHLWATRFAEIRRIADFALKGVPVRIVRIHVLNAPALFWPMYQIGKRFIKEKILKRVHFHDDLESLHQYFNKTKLPESLGGDLTEDEAIERDVLEDILKKDVPYEEYWNGGPRS